MTTMNNVASAEPVAPWLGGKKALHRAIIARIDAIEHKSYIEPFVGMGGVFLRRRWQPSLEVANDLNGEITNLFRILQRHYPQFVEVLRFQITSRREFDRLKKSDPACLTDLERAARFLYLQRLAFGGKINGVFGVARDRTARFNLSNLGPMLDAAHSRLEGVVFESLDWQEVVRRYDGPHSLFYLDPPYFGGENDYGKGMFDRSQYEAMAKVLVSIEGSFILSINDCPEIRETFAGFLQEQVHLKYTVSSGAAKDATELIISNREVKTSLL